jgi:hypothetical protein
VVSVEDTTEIWETEGHDREGQGNKNRVTGTDSPMVDEKGGGEVLLAQQSRRDKHEHEENRSP